MAGNKRISQLVELFTADVVGSDLLAIVDTPNRETKKITVTNFAAWVSASGSLFAVHSLTADTASYILGSGVHGTVSSASYALKSTNTDSASYSTFALNASSSLYAQTSSWSINVINSGTTLQTGSTYPITASWANNVVIARTASFLLYTGFDNGTASYAIKTENVTHADTASFFDSTMGVVSTASYAGHSDTADTATNAVTASFLEYAGFFNGTASFALNTSNTALGGNILNDFGLFLATTQSTNEAQIDTLIISPSTPIAISTLIEAIGSSVLNFTSSIQSNDSISLSILDRNTGISQVLDTVPVFFNTTTIIDNWNTLLTGSISTPFLLAGQITGSGSFVVEVNSTLSASIGPRITRFTVASNSDIVSSQADEIIDLAWDPTGSYAIFYSGSTGPFTDALFGLRITGSQYITSMSLVNQNISDIRYTWKAIRLQSLDISYNTSLQSFTYAFPNVINKLICNSCSLNNFNTSISNTSMSYFDCSYNFLSSLPDLPQTNYSMSYFNCSNNLMSNLPTLAPTMSIINCSGNPLTSIPSTLPFGLQKMFCDSSSLLVVLSNFPNSVISLSFQNNSQLQFWSSPFSSSLRYFNGSFSPLGTGEFPLPNLSMSAILLQNSSLPALGASSSMNAVCSQSLFNAQNYGLISGTIDIRGNGFPDFNTLLNYINPLTSTYSWTVLHD